MTTARLLIPLLLLFAVFLLARGHDAPGGGFIAGLVVATAIALHALAFDIKSARALVRVHPRILVGTGLLISLVSALPGYVAGSPLMTGVWVELSIGSGGVKLGTPLLFDLGVFLVVTGMVMISILWLAEEEGA